MASYSDVDEVVCIGRHLDTSARRALVAAFVNKRPLVVRCSRSLAERAELWKDWESFVNRPSRIKYSTYKHGPQHLKCAWYHASGMRIETSLKGVEANPVREWLEQSSPGSVAHDVGQIQGQLDNFVKR